MGDTPSQSNVTLGFLGSAAGTYVARLRREPASRAAKVAQARERFGRPNYPSKAELRQMAVLLSGYL